MIRSVDGKSCEEYNIARIFRGLGFFASFCNVLLPSKNNMSIFLAPILNEIVSEPEQGQVFVNISHFSYPKYRTACLILLSIYQWPVPVTNKLG